MPDTALLLVQPSPTVPAGTDARSTARTALATVTLSLIGRGMGEEVALLERARVLRSRIETPDEQPARRPDRPRPAADAPTNAVAEVRTAFLAAPLGSPLRAELLRWIRPGLLATVEAVAAEASSSAPEPVTARTRGGVIEVSPSGVTPDQRQWAETRVRGGYPLPPRWSLVAPGVIGLVLLVTTVVAAGLGSTSLAVLTGLGTVITLVLVARAVLADRRRRRDLQLDLEATRTALDQAEARAQQAESARQKTVADSQRLAAALRDRLGASVAQPVR